MLRPIDQLADGIHQLRGRPRNAINVYLAGDVLIDAGTQGARKGILRQLQGLPVAAHALTHAHPDHFGSSHPVCEALGIPLWCGERDASVVEGERPAPGHVAYWREGDGTLICGDVLFNLTLPTLRPVLREPYRAFTPDPARNRDSARRLAELRPKLVLFGHGPPLRDTERFVRFVDGLPA